MIELTKSTAKKIFENHSKNKVLIVRENICGGCGYCIEVCPQNCLEFSTKVNQRIVYPVKAKDRSCVECYLCLEDDLTKCPWGSCTACNRCMNICPDFAIYTA